VIERYVDPSYKFSGLGSFLKYFLTSSCHRAAKAGEITTTKQ
jgi:hypothetical protein